MVRLSKVEQKIQEYTEVYGDILLGLHEELQAQKRSIQSIKMLMDKHRQDMTNTLSEAKLIGEAVKERDRRIKIALSLAIISVVLSLVSFGIVIWTRL